MLEELANRKLKWKLFYDWLYYFYACHLQVKVLWLSLTDAPKKDSIKRMGSVGLHFLITKEATDEQSIPSCNHADSAYLYRLTTQVFKKID